MPNWFAQSRLLAGGDWRAGALLYRIRQVWLGAEKKLNRCGRQWVAMPRAHWARSAGLSDSEIKNYALPELKAQCKDFLTFEPWKVRQGGPKVLFISIDEAVMHEKFDLLDDLALASGTEDYHQPVGGIGFEVGVQEGSNVVEVAFGQKADLDHL